LSYSAVDLRLALIYILSLLVTTSTNFNNFFVRALDVHQYVTRNTNQLKYSTPKYRLVKYHKSLKYVGV